MNSIKTILKNYHAKQRLKQQMASIYYKKLIKASLLISTVPIIVIAILIVYERLTLLEGIIGIVAVFFGSTFFAKPYLDDLSALTKYVEQLALDKKAEAPPLSFLGNVEVLSEMVQNLHRSWGNRKLELEAALAESSILFDTIPDILIMLDKKLNIVRANNAALSIFNKDIVGMRLKTLIPKQALIDSIKSAYNSGNGNSLEISFKAQNTTEDYLAMAEKFPVKSIGDIATVLIMHNITESRRRKQMLKDFVSNASHEIRTPLTSVNGFIENLQEMENEENPKNKQTRKKFLSIMSEQTERMSDLIDDLLSLSRAEISENTVPTELVDIDDILQSTKRRLQWLAEQKNMIISITKKTSLPQVIGDPNELAQVFTNIISNALKYGYSNTTIKITSSVTKDFHKLKHMPKNCNELLLISVEDEGEGIADEHISRITERFYRVDKTRSRKIGGTGLGLSITKHILIRHKADLLIESANNKGSIFTVRLPVPNIRNKKAV